MHAYCFIKADVLLGHSTVRILTFGQRIFLMTLNLAN